MAIGEVCVRQGKQGHGAIVAAALRHNARVDRTAKRLPRTQQDASDLAYWLARPMASALPRVESCA